MRGRQDNYYKVTGGHLKIDDDTYVHREADKELCEFVRNPKTRLCFVLAPRQMGKTSLMVKTADKLKTENFISIPLFVQGILETPSLKVFYKSVLRLIGQHLTQQVKDFNTNFNSTLDSYFNEPTLALGLLFKEFLLKEVTERIDSTVVIYLDEIQTLISLGLQNEFFGLMRSLEEEPTDSLKLKKIKFVLLGVANPSDLINDTNYVWNVGNSIELTGLEKEECEPLQRGLDAISEAPKELLEQIIFWTQGQPFLTQLICQLVVNRGQIVNIVNVKDYIKTLIEHEIINDYKWRKSDKQQHFLHIQNYFLPVNSSKELQEKLAALELYKQIILNKLELIQFDISKNEKWNLILLGLLGKNKDGNLKVTNPIYERIFSEHWLEATKNDLQKRMESIMQEDPLSTIYNRDVFILIDRSGSMTKKDAADSTLKRWDSLQELIMGHVEAILPETEKLVTQDREQKIICDSISISLFNKNQVGPSRQVIKSEHVENIFMEYKPAGATFVTPTLRDCINKWFDSRNTSGTQGAFFIIYTDGQFDELEKFEQLITQTCSKLSDERLIKIIVIGIGKDIDKNYFQQLDDNLKNNVDKDGNSCDIVDFELETEMDDILEIMKRELITKR